MCSQAAQAAETSGTMPCHGGDQQHKSGALMMLKDCAGLDLMPGQYMAELQAPQFDIGDNAFPGVAVIERQIAVTDGVIPIRGPPLRDGRRHSPEPFTLLITQRFRI